MNHTTKAEKIGALLGGDGQIFETKDGRSLDSLCAEAVGHDHPDWRDGYRAGDVYAWRFDDGSSIVIGGDAWDFGISCECFCWAGMGHDACDIKTTEDR